jgi:drug/metabolite transporter (DMT)-like permease
MPVRWHEPIDTRRLPLAGLLAALIAAGVNIGLREAGRRWLNVPANEPLLSLFWVSVVTVGAVIAATLGMGAFAHTQARPFTVFRGFAGVVLLASCAGPLLARTGWVAAIGRVSTHTMAVMLLMHLLSAAVIVIVLTTLPRAYESRPL